MPAEPTSPPESPRAKLAAILKGASEELLANGDTEGARIAIDALKELRELADAPKPPTSPESE